jgi:hypothetical protein
LPLILVQLHSVSQPMTRCKTGSRLLKHWAQRVQNATMGTWQQIMFEPRAYDRHVEKCKKCAGARAIKAAPQDLKL